MINTRELVPHYESSENAAVWGELVAAARRVNEIKDAVSATVTFPTSEKYQPYSVFEAILEPHKTKGLLIKGLMKLTDPVRTQAVDLSDP